MKATRLLITLTTMMLCTAAVANAQTPVTLTLGVNDPQMGSVSIDDDTIYINCLTSSSLFNEMTVIDANNDEFTWYCYDGAVYTEDCDYGHSANDWLVSPALTLRGGVEYIISIQSACAMTNYPERFEIKAATACNATALNGGTVIIAATTVSHTNWNTYTGTFTPTDNGTYYIGIHAISNANMDELYVKDFSVVHPSGIIDNGDGTYSVPSGTEVTVTATPEDCHALTGWSNGAELNADGTVTFTVTGNMTLTATFASLATTGDTTAAACDQFAWHGQTYTATPAEAPTYTTTNAAGCDSVVTLLLTINHSTTGDTTAEATGSFTWHGQTYTQTPTEDPTFIYQTVQGCDSTVTLHLTITTEGIFTISDAHASLAVYPNPAVSHQQVRIAIADAAAMQGAQLAIFDLQGRKAFEQPFSGTCSVTLSTGIYTLRLTLDDGTRAYSRLIVE